MIYKWNYSTLSKDQTILQDDLSKALGIDPELSKLLILRGIDSRESAKEFFYPDLAKLHDPLLMPDMALAVKRIEKALGNKERILIYGDYDVDGTTAVSLVYKFLRRFSSNIDYYIPDRYDEGYGISIRSIDFASETGVSLIVSLDCGIKAITKVDYAKEKGIDFIICDHHKPDDQLPDAYAVLDAKRTDSIYPYDELSGCGVGFKLVQAIAANNQIPFSEIEGLLDFVAISIAADIVPLTGENRVLMHYGLKQLNSNPSFGIRAILETTGLVRKEIKASDIIFKIGPRINASGRMMNGKEAVELMLSPDMISARKKCLSIDKYNDDRRELDKRITDEAIDYIDNNVDVKSLKSIVVYDETWHKGIIGIVASRLTERYFRPAVVLTKSHGLISGSARSVQGFDVYNALDECRDLLENFGGHMYAAGLSLTEENFLRFKKRFERISFDGVEPKMMRAQINIDTEITFSHITPEFVKRLKMFNPYGPENEPPVFVTRNVYDSGQSRLTGKMMQHIKLHIEDGTTAYPMQAIAFGMSDRFNLLNNKSKVDICYTIEENYYNGKTSLQLIVKDIKEAQY